MFKKTLSAAFAALAIIGCNEKNFELPEENSGEKVQLIGFGTFEVKERAAREGYNPFTKEKKDILGGVNGVLNAL